MNKIRLSKTGLLLNIFFLSATLHAEISLPSIFGDHMVLQQETNAKIWGKSSPGKTVKIVSSWDDKEYSTRADSKGNWDIKILTPSAGGPYDLTISDGSVLVLKDILIGEVWLCSGQSNMEMPMKGFRNQPVAGSTEAISSSENNLIRLITVKKDKSFQRLDDFSGEWKECIPENVSGFSATAYFYGKKLQQDLGVPVGLICSSWGGTRIEPWFSKEDLQNFDWIDFPEKTKEDFSKQLPAVLFNAMINPIVGYSIRGVIWYQGETNRWDPAHYDELLPAFVRDWRDEWDIGEFPFYYAQIAPYDYKKIEINSAFLREAQLKASKLIPNSGMACLMDCGERDCIHPANKEAAGNRLAYLALARTYGKGGFECESPVLDKMIIDGGIVKLTFLNAKNGLTSYGKELNNFMIAGSNKHFYPAKAVITKEGISLSSPSVSKPVAVRYAFDDFVIGDLFNTGGLPASSFRTDDW